MGPTSLALRRLWARRLESAVAVCALSIAFAGVATLRARTVMTGDLAMRESLASLPPAERSITVVVAPEAPLGDDRLATIDRALRARLRGPGFGTLRHLVEFRPLAATDGSLYRLGGAADLASAYTLVAGRLPARCSAARCEVVAVRGPNRPTAPISPALRTPLAGLEVVGEVRARDLVAFTGELEPESREALLVADLGAGTAAGAVADWPESLRLLRRIHAWVGQIDPGELTTSTVDEFLDRIAKSTSDVDLAGFAVNAPDAELRRARADAADAAKRLALAASALAALVLVTLGVVGVALRGSHQQARLRLGRRGARRAVLVRYDLATAGVLVAASMVLGIAIAGALTGWSASVDDLPAGPAVRRLVQPTELATMLLAATLATLGLAAMLRSRVGVDVATSLRRPRWFDALGALSALTVGLGLARRSSETASADLSTWLLPLVVPAGIAWCCARLVPPVLGLFARVGARRRTRNDPDLQIRRLVRQSAADETRTVTTRNVVTATAIATAVAFLLFGEGYASTLRRSIDERAAFAVPMDARLTVGSELVRPPSLAPPEGWSSVTNMRASNTDVLRTAATVTTTGSEAESVEVLGLHPDVLGRLVHQRFGRGKSARELPELLRVSRPPSVLTPLPEGATRLRARVAGGQDGVSTLRQWAVVARADGTWTEVELAWTGPATVEGDLLEKPAPGAAKLPAVVGLVGFRFAQPAITAAHLEHHVQEGHTSADAAEVTIRITEVEAVASNGTVSRIGLSAGRFSAGESTVRPAGKTGIEVGAQIQGSSLLIVPNYTGDTVRVLVDPVTAKAADGRMLTLRTLRSTRVVEIAAVIDRFPTLGERFVVGDLSSLSLLYNLDEPSAGTPSEVWLRALQTAPGSAFAQRLASPPFTSVNVALRSGTRAELLGDPIARSLLTTLRWLAGASLAVGLGALALALRSSRRERSAYSSSLGLDGLSGRERTLLTRRPFVLLTVGAIPIGLLGGWVLSRSVVRAVQQSVGSAGSVSLTQPPLVLSLPWWLTATVVIVVAFASAAVLRLAARRGTEDLVGTLRAESM